MVLSGGSKDPPLESGMKNEDVKMGRLWDL